MLNVLDEKWKDHLYDLDQLRAAINFRAWGQKDPLIEYKQEAYSMFVDLMADVYHTFAERFLRVQVVFEPPPGTAAARGPAAPARRSRRSLRDEGGHAGTASAPRWTSAPASPAPRRRSRAPSRRSSAPAASRRSTAEPGGAPQDWSNVGRNDPCPCGSGKKFKKCHGTAV